MSDHYTSDGNKERQIEELAAISAIYGDDFEEENPAEGSYVIHLTSLNGATIDLKITLPEPYPTHCPPMYEIRAPWMERSVKKNLHEALQNIYLENIGEPVIFQWAEKVREFLPETLESPFDGSNTKTAEVNQVVEDSEPIECPQIFHGEPLTDRKSVFQAHVAEVNSTDQVNVVHESLLRNKKVANATHNIVAYRFQNNAGILVQDCDDDGETAAGGRLLHLLNILNVTNVLVIVTRWYGGIHLGPDRFKHINNVARSVLSDNGFLKVQK